MYLRERIKWCLFPGFNLHARLRWKLIPPSFGTSDNGTPRVVLDAGCGNGMLSYQSYLRGNRVIGVNFESSQVARCKKLFNDFLHVPEDRLRFDVKNLYDLGEVEEFFDEIVCSETLEHIKGDTEVCQSFWDKLKPGGILHLCCPNAEHPDHINYVLDLDEKGGHVRPGYTMESYRALLEPLGFQMLECKGVGGKVRQVFNKRLIRMEEKIGLPGAVAVFLLAQPFVWLDRFISSTPYSLYIRAIKPETSPS